MAEKKIKQKSREEIREEERRRKRKEEKEESRKKAEEKRVEKKEKVSKDLKPVALPEIELEEPTITEKKPKLVEEVPSLESEERKIPDLELQEIEVRKKRVKIDSEVPTIEKVKEIKAPPIVRASSPKIRSKISKFDDSEPKVKKPPERKFKIPVYRKKKSPKIRARIASLASTISKEVIDQIELAEEEKEEVLAEREEERGAVAGAPSGRKGEEKLPIFENLIFNTKGSSIDSKGTKVIFAPKIEDDEYVGVLETLCKRIYREKNEEGGKPRAKKVKKTGEEGVREVEKWMRGENRIFTINLTGEIDPDKILERLDEIYSQGLGFIIFQVSPENMDLASEIFQQIPNLSHPFLPVVVVPKQNLVNRLDLKRKIAEMAFGNVNLKETPINIFNIIFEEALNLFWTSDSSKLERIMKSEDGLFESSTERDRDASLFHYALKVFTLKYLVKRKRKEGLTLRTKDEIQNVISTEDESYEERNILPDIVYENSAAYEIETLFGKGSKAHKKLEEKIEDYENVFEEINFVLDNLTFLRHLDHIRQILKHNRRKSIDINFYTVDVEKETLIPYKEVKNQVKELEESLAQKEEILH